MFGLTTKKQLLENEKVVNSKIAEFSALVVSLSEEVKTLRTEIHGCQTALYKLLDKLQYDLVMGEDGNPEIVARK